MQSQLEQLWLDLWKRIGAKGDPLEVYALIEVLYANHSRRYHNFAHIGRCLEEFENALPVAPTARAIEWAIWFHDAEDTEEKSAKLAVLSAKGAGLPDSFGQTVTELIIATKHKQIPTSLGAQIICDIDLSILGRPEAEFDEYERQIREEYRHVPEDIFNAKRSEILRSFLTRSAIFYIPYFHDKYEEQARRNIARSLARLNA